MLIVLAGYPEPIVNVIIGHENGEWRIRLDLSYPHLKLVLEYDGWHHRLDRRQWSSDLKRREWLEGRGWRVIVVNSEAFYGEPVETLLRIRGAMLSRGERRLPLRPPAAWVREFVKPVGTKLTTGGVIDPSSAARGRELAIGGVSPKEGAGAGKGSRTPMSLRTGGFEPPAYTIPPPRPRPESVCHSRNRAWLQCRCDC